MGSGDCFEGPSHISYVFAVRVKMKRKWIFRFLVKRIGEVIALFLL